MAFQEYSQLNTSFYVNGFGNLTQEAVTKREAMEMGIARISKLV